ncbi:MAG: DUF368 domain-containing protein [Lachnospiraceae bacterium]|nr:DUF368 domain-containing protein [Lachnospiraceae bacterium]
MNFLLDIVRGVVIGIANIIPGVSGGTMMVAMGIYDKLIGSITGIFKQLKKSIRTLFPYVIGMIAGIAAFSYLLTKVLLVKFPLPTAFAFIGLIAGGIPVLVKRAKKSTKGGFVSCAAVFVLFFALIIAMQFLGEGAEKAVTPSVLNVVVMAVMGVLAAAAMVIPGVSGSLLLLAFGYYNPITEAVTEFIAAVFHRNLPVLLEKTAILFPFGIGVLLGIFFVAKLIEWLLARHEKLTYCGILGLVAASPVPVFMNALGGAAGVGVILASAVTFCAGFAVAYFMGRE